MPPDTHADALNIFPATSAADWRGLVDKVLKGGSFDKLVGKSADARAIQPLYARQMQDGPRPWRAAAGAWDMCARIDHSLIPDAHAQALEDLENGASGLTFVFHDAPDAFGFGLKDTSASGIAHLLDGIYLDTGVAIQIHAGASAFDIAQHVQAVVAAAKVDPAQTRINFGFDPLGLAAATGYAPAATWAQQLGATVKTLRSAGFTHPCVVADGRAVHAAGGSEAQELAFVLSAGVANLRALEAAGLSLEDAQAALCFRLAADADQFLTLTKLRALRRLWAQVQQACGLPAHPIYVEAETAWRMLTRRDPWVNLLRNTLGCFSAALGGADAITVLPFTQALGLPDGFARRLARNTQLVLLEEAHLDKVADPAAGAGGFEALTEDLAQTAWALFQAQESAGGVQASLQAGSLQAAIAKTAAAHHRAIATRREPLTGVSEFAHLREAPVSVLAAWSDAHKSHPQGDFAALIPQRLAAGFEALRDRADQKTPAPSVFLATLGPLSAYSARASFAKNLYEAGGISAPIPEGFETTDALLTAFQASGTQLACICASDALYAERAVDVAKALKAAGASEILLAGRPGDLEGPLKEAGVSGFLYMGCDVLDLLQATHAKL